MNASMPSSAQCRSSTTTTAGPSDARPSRKPRQTAKFSSRAASSASRPSSGRRRARVRSRSSPSGRTVSSRASARATPSLSRMPAEDRTISESAQKVTPEPNGRQRPWRQTTSSGSSSSRRANSASSRLLPMPGSPTMRPRRDGLRSGAASASSPSSSASSSSRPTKLVVKLRSSAPVRTQRRRGDPGAQRLALALERDRVTGLEGEDLLGGGVRGLADGDAHRRRGGLQPRRHIDGVAGEEAFAGRRVDAEVDERLAGVHADAHLEGAATDAGQGVDLVDQAQPGAHRALGVVLVRRRHAEHAHDGVADELLDGAAVRLDDPPRRAVVAAQQRVDVLRVVALAQRREPDDVAEEGGDDAAFLGASRLRAAPVGEPADGDAPCSILYPSSSQCTAGVAGSQGTPVGRCCPPARVNRRTLAMPSRSARPLAGVRCAGVTPHWWRIGAACGTTTSAGGRSRLAY